jgi:hypothetical protein
MADKKFKLSEEETKNLKGREQAIDYVVDLIKRDINMYLYMDVVPRLGLSQDGKYELTPDREWLHVTEEAPKAKLILPNGVKNAKN